jgi:hypothetical protein
VFAIARISRNSSKPNPPATIAGLLPYFAFNMPVKTIAATEPSLRQSRSDPSTALAVPSRCLAKGTSGAEQASAKPAAKMRRLSIAVFRAIR